jgi:hypothetical protein
MAVLVPAGPDSIESGMDAVEFGATVTLEGTVQLLQLPHVAMSAYEADVFPAFVNEKLRLTDAFAPTS